MRKFDIAQIHIHRNASRDPNVQPILKNLGMPSSKLRWIHRCPVSRRNFTKICFNSGPISLSNSRCQRNCICNLFYVMIHMQLASYHMHVTLCSTDDYWFLWHLLYYLISSGKTVCSITLHSKSRFRAGRVLANTRNAWQTNGLFWRTNARPWRELTILGIDRVKLTLFTLVGN